MIPNSRLKLSRANIKSCPSASRTQGKLQWDSNSRHLMWPHPECTAIDCSLHGFSLGLALLPPFSFPQQIFHIFYTSNSLRLSLCFGFSLTASCSAVSWIHCMGFQVFWNVGKYIHSPATLTFCIPVKIESTIRGVSLQYSMAVFPDSISRLFQTLASNHFQMY